MATRYSVKSLINNEFLLACAGVLWCCVGSLPVHAEDITVRFTGRVTAFNDVYCQCLVGVEIGSPVSGYYVYDPDLVDSDPDPHKGRYLHSNSPYGFVAWVGAHEYRSDPSNIEFLVTLNDSVVDQYGLHDSYGLRDDSPIDTLYTPIIRFFLWLRDNTATALSSDSLPVGAPVLEDWPTLRQLNFLGDGFEIWADILFIAEGAPTGIAIPQRTDLSLRQNHPNPLNPSTTIAFTLAKRTHVNLSVYDVQGKLVATLVDAILPPGPNETRWGGQDSKGNAVTSGVYFYRLVAGGRILAKKMVVLR